MKEVSLEKETNANSTIKTGSILNYKIKIPKVDMIMLPILHFYYKL